MASFQFPSNLPLLFHHVCYAPLPPFSISICPNSKPKWKMMQKHGAACFLPPNIIATPLLFPTRRALNVSVFSLLFYCHPASAQPLDLQRYTDSKEGFTLLRPSSWLKVDKPGATVLFQDQHNNKGTNNLGVVVNPVRLTTLAHFGTPHFVAQKLIHAEKRKESTKDAAVVGVAERSGEGGLQVYEFEYTVDSTRGGMKWVFSAAFVASKKLYILNISHSDNPDSPLDSQRRMMLEQVLHSFDAAPPSL